MKKTYMRFFAVCLLICMFIGIVNPLVYADDVAIQVLDEDAQSVLEDNNIDVILEQTPEPTAEPTLEPTVESIPEPTQVPPENIDIIEQPSNNVQISTNKLLVRYYDNNGEKIIEGSKYNVTDTIDGIELSGDISLSEFITEQQENNKNILYIQPDYEVNQASVSENWSIGDGAPMNGASVNKSIYNKKDISTYQFETHMMGSKINVAKELANGANVKIGLLDTAVSIEQPNPTAWHGTMLHYILSYIAPNSEIVCSDIFDDGKASVSSVIKAIDECKKQGVSIVNSSWTINGENPVLESVIKESNMLFVCAAGNNKKDISKTPVYPAAFELDNVLTVGAVDNEGQICNYSNYSKDLVDIFAQGDATYSKRDGGEEYSSNGTSFAAAFVSGTAALVASQNTTLTVKEIKEKIINTAVSYANLLAYGKDGKFLNAENALKNTVIEDIVAVKKESIAQVYSMQDSAPKTQATVSNEWTEAGELQTQKFDFDTVAYNEKIYIFGGTDKNTHKGLDSVQVYDPQTNTSVELAPMPHARYSPLAELIGDEIYVLSGNNTDKSIDVYDIATNTWTTPMEFPYDNSAYSVEVWHEGLYVLGGNNTNNAYRYDLERKDWEQCPSLIKSMYGGQCVGTDYDVNNNGTFKEGIYIIDGDGSGFAIAYDQGYQYIDVIDELAGQALAAYGSGREFKIFITGGADMHGENPINRCSVKYYNDAIYGKQVSWFDMQSLPEPMSYHSSVVIGEYLYVLGGKTTNKIYRLSASAPIDDEGYTFTTGGAHGTINYVSDIDYFVFIPERSGTYSISPHTKFMPGFTMPGVFAGGDLWNGFLEHLEAGKAYPFTVFSEYENEFCERYSFGFHLEIEDEKTIKPLESNRYYEESCDNEKPKMWYSTVGNIVSIICKQDIVVQTYCLDESREYELTAGAHILGSSIGSATVSVRPKSGEWNTQSIKIGGFTESKYVQTSPMKTSRNKFESVGLGNAGYILGGYNENGIVSSVEKIADNSACSQETEIPTPVLGFGATVNENSIYVVGGYKNGECYAGLQIYDTVTKTWSTGANMPEARERCSAVCYNGKLYVIGGRTGSEYSDSVLIYDISTNTWTKQSMPQISLIGADAVVINDAIYVVGGLNETGNASNRLFNVSPIDLSVNELKNVPSNSVQVKGSAVDNALYVIGIHEDMIYTYEYNIFLNTWTTKNEPARKNLTYYDIQSIDDRLYILGGYDNTYSADIYSQYVQKISSSTNWEYNSQLPVALNKAETLLIDNEKYVVGGFNGKAQRAIYKHNAENGAWENITTIPTSRFGYSAQYYDGNIYIIGGTQNSSYAPDVDIYNISTKTWSKGTPMISAKERMGSIVYNKKIYVVGGRNETGALDTIEEYNIETKQWTTVGKLPEAQMNTSVASLRDGLLIVGGFNDEGSVLNSYTIYNKTTKQCTAPKTNKLLDGYISKISGVNTLLFTTTNKTSSQVSFVEYDQDKSAWTQVMSESRLPELMYASYLADGNTVYCIGGYGIKGKNNSLTVYSKDYKANVQEDTNSSVFDSAVLQVQKDKLYPVAISVQDIQSFDGKQFAVTYDPSMFEVSDLCGQTWGKDTQIGDVADTDITIVSSTAGEFVFKSNQILETGKTMSGVINIVKLKAMSDGSGNISVDMSN